MAANDIAKWQEALSKNGMLLDGEEVVDTQSVEKAGLLFGIILYERKTGDFVLTNKRLFYFIRKIVFNPSFDPTFAGLFQENRVFDLTKIKDVKSISPWIFTVTGYEDNAAKEIKQGFRRMKKKAWIEKINDARTKASN